jgi:hypothetical protein
MEKDVLKRTNLLLLSLKFNVKGDEQDNGGNQRDGNNSLKHP